MTRTLVLGSAGMLGHVVVQQLLADGHAVTGLQRSPSTLPRAVRADALDFVSLNALLEDGKFDAVVNCVGILNHTATLDPALTVMTNSYLPQWLAMRATDYSFRLIQISTDCVFSGASGGYSEDSPMDAQDLYGRSKALGEVRENPQVVTLRTSIVGPDLNKNGTGLLNWFLQCPPTVKGYSRVIWGGVTTSVLAGVVSRAIDSPELSGVLHVTNGEPIAKLELLKLFAEHLRPEARIQSDGTAVNDKSMITIRGDMAPKIPSYDEMVAEMARWTRDHASWYPHYALGH